jgi:threonine dehydrogenase-like Zn-dependent dehydrogenase
LLPAGADIVVDAVGSQFGPAIEAAGLGGRIVLFGQNATVNPAVHQYTITERSLTVMGTYITACTFPQAIRMVEQGILNLAPIVTHVLPLEQLADGLDLLRSGVATKVVITTG